MHGGRSLIAAASARRIAQGIRRTTPPLLGLFSLVTLLAHRRMTASIAATRQDAWYRNPHPTFVDALALVRRDLWRHQTFHASPCGPETVKVPRAVLDLLTEKLSFPA